MIGDADLKSIFVTFASFGAGNAGATTMDNARFAKFCKDTKIVDTKYTTTSIDIIFNKVKKVKTERRINFEEFKHALEEIAKEKYKGAADGLEKVHGLISAHGGPSNSGTQADASGIYSKLTDHEQYTGVYKERFDGDGKGKGVQINGGAGK
eukprot:tig00021127_g18881.t1